MPKLWLMTDERMGEQLWAAIAALPRGAGIVFRHHATAPGERRILFARIRRLAKHKGLVLVRAGATSFPGEAGIHGVGKHPGGLRTWPAHSQAEAMAGKRAGADLLFVSPIFPTRSHPGAPVLGPRSAAAIARIGVPCIALGGMDAVQFKRLRGSGYYGWAAIDAWMPDQKRKAVPI